MSTVGPLPKWLHPDFRIPGKKPVGNVELSDTIFGGNIVSAYIPTTDALLDYVNGRGNNVGNDVQLINSPAGKAARFDGSTNGYIEYSNPFPVMDEITILCRLRRHTTSLNQGIISDKEDDNWTANEGFSISLRTAGNGGLLFLRGNSMTRGDATFDIGTSWNDIAACDSNGNNAQLFKNGVEPASYVNPVVMSSPAKSRNPVRIGSYYSEWTFDGDIEYIIVLDKRLTADEIRLAQADIYRHALKPKSPMMAYFGSAAGGVTVSPPVGSLTITGIAPTVIADADIDVSVPVAALEITGFNPIAQTGNNITVEPQLGSIDITGLAPIASVSNNIDLEVPAGALSIAGFTPSIDITGLTVVEVPSGELTVSGYAPKMAYGPALVAVPAGSISINGLAPSVIAGGAVWTKQPDTTTIWAAQLDNTTLWTKQ